MATVKGHPAPFPDSIPRRLIELYSSPGETVLDPFVGSGTTAVVGAEMERHSVAYEISEEYCELSRRRLESRNLSLGT